MTTASMAEPCYGLIEWDGSYTPTLIVGCCPDAVSRTAVRIFAQATDGRGQLASDDPDFLTEHPIPDPDDPHADIGGWLDELREVTTVPWFTLLAGDDIVCTGETIRVDWATSVPCTSHRRPAGAATAATVAAPATDRRIPATVNGYPVVAALPMHEDGPGWWVTCHRTEPAYTGATAPLYVVWSAWIDADGIGQGQNGDYGPGPGLTFTQAYQCLLERAGYTHRRPATTAVTREGSEAASIVISGERIDLWAQRSSRDHLRIDVCTEPGFGCGEATLHHGELRMSLPDGWSAGDRVRVACLITQIAYIGITGRWDTAPGTNTQ